jgi:hypothetical protein
MDKEKIDKYLEKADEGVKKAKDLTSEKGERVKELTKFGHEPHAAEKDLENSKQLEQSVEQTREIITEQLKENPEG